MYPIENEEKALFQAFKNSSVTCFENENYVECLYINEESFYTVSIFNISPKSPLNLYGEILYVSGSIIIFKREIIQPAILFSFIFSLPVRKFTLELILFK